MARGYGRRRGGGLTLSPKVIMIIAGVALVVVVGAIFFFSGQAESRRPEQKEIRVPATNVGVQPETPPAPAGGANAPSQ
jgi:hypothetical protein